MHTTKHIKPILTALTATLILATAIGTASARNLSTSNQLIRITWTSLEFESRGAGVTIKCQVTLEGSFHSRTIAKSPGALIGAVTRAQVKQETCTGGTGVAFNGTERYNGTTSPNTLPWHAQYKNFTGTLPRIASLGLAISRFRVGIRDSGGICTGQYGTAEDSVTFNGAREEGGAITGAAPAAGENIFTLSRRDGGLLCPSPVELRGTGQVTLLGNTTRITITLI